MLRGPVLEHTCSVRWWVTAASYLCCLIVTPEAYATAAGASKDTEHSHQPDGITKLTKQRGTVKTKNWREIGLEIRYTHLHVSLKPVDGDKVVGMNECQRQNDSVGEKHGQRIKNGPGMKKKKKKRKRGEGVWACDWWGKKRKLWGESGREQLMTGGEEEWEEGAGEA